MLAEKRINFRVVAAAVCCESGIFVEYFRTTERPVVFSSLLRMSIKDAEVLMHRTAQRGRTGFLL